MTDLMGGGVGRKEGRKEGYVERRVEIGKGRMETERGKGER